NLRALHNVTDLGEHLSRDCQTFFAPFLFGFGFAHPLHYWRRNGSARYLVVHELCIAERSKRPNSRQYRNLAMFDPIHKSDQLFHVKPWLRYRVFRACINLPFKSADFMIQVRCAGIDADADMPSSRLTDRVAANIHSLIESGRHISQPNSIHIEYRGGI